jgi:hypothetical protein
MRGRGLIPNGCGPLTGRFMFLTARQMVMICYKNWRLPAVVYTFIHVYTIAIVGLMTGSLLSYY